MRLDYNGSNNPGFINGQQHDQNFEKEIFR